MMGFEWITVSGALPEIFLAGAILALLMVGVFSPAERSARNVSGLALVTLVITYVMMHTSPMNPAFFKGTVGSMFISDNFSYYMKVLILISAAAVIMMSGDFLRQKKLDKFEFYILLLLSVLGMMLMVSANDLLSLYVSLELMSFSIYILAAFWRDNLRSSEAGLKYFIMGSIASGILLYGISLMYGFAGDTSFAGIAQALQGADVNQFGLGVALVMILTGLAFKVSAVPFHMWTPDVYEGAPMPVTAFMASAPKVAAIALMMRVLTQPLMEMNDHWIQIIAVLSVLTMAVGSILAIAQTNIKRLLAYSSIGNVGFMLVGLVAGTHAGIEAMLVYMTIYLAMTLGIFALMLSLRRKNIFIDKIDDIVGLSQIAPGAAFMMLILMFSLAGVPPLAGFFAKFYVFSAAVQAGYTWLAVVGVLFSVVAAYYCLRIIKTMYFDKGKGRFDAARPMGARMVALAFAASMIVLSVFIDVIDGPASRAAENLLPETNIAALEH